MEISTKQMIDDSPSIKSTTLIYSPNFILTSGGVLNIYNNLTEEDCKAILLTKKLVQIQFASAFTVNFKTFDLINFYLLDHENEPTFRFNLNGFGAIKDLSCLSHLSKLKSLTADMHENNQLDRINQHLNLTKIGIGGRGISIAPLVQQINLEEVFLFEKLKNIEVLGSMKKLKKITFSKMTLKNLDFLTTLDNLTELHFILGSATNYERLSEIGKIEKLSFTRVRKLTKDHLLPINKMAYLKELKLDTLAHIKNIDWLINKNIKTEIY